MSLFSPTLRAPCASLALLLSASNADATDVLIEKDGSVEKPSPIFESPKKVTGQFEVGFGWLALPTAQVCSAESCSQGDTTPLIEIWNLVHFDSGFAVGAGVTLGLAPTSTMPQEDDGVDREHTRSYMTFEAIGRYYPRIFADWDVWIGPGLGLAVVTDRFISNENESSQIRIESPGFTLRSEALSLFLAGGVSYSLSKRWHIGGGARAGRFGLPQTPARSPLGDEASIVGPTFYVFAGLNISIHAEL